MRLLAPKEIAQRLSISRSAAYRLAKRLEHVYVESSIRVRESVLEAYLARQTIRPVMPGRRASSAARKGYPRADGTKTVRPTQPGTTPKKDRRG